MGSCCTFSSAPLPLGLLREQDGAEAVEIAPDHGQGDVAFEAVDAMVAANIQSVRLQGVDGRFHAGVVAAQANELRIALALELGRRALALLSNDSKTSYTSLIDYQKI